MFMRAAQPNLDDRVNVVNVGNINLWTSSGSQVIPTHAPSVSYNSSAGPGPETVTLLYAPTDLTNVTQLQFLNDAFEVPGLATANAWQSVPQIVSAPSSAAILRAYHAEQARTHHAKRHKRHKK